MPDIDERIATWRSALAVQLGGDADILSELETHLRDEIAHLIQKGETPDRAADLAVAHIGVPSELAREFAKSGTWLPIYFVLGISVLFFGLVMWGCSEICFAVDRGQPDWLIQPDWLMFSYVFAHFARCILIFAIGGLANCYAMQRTWRDLSFGQARTWNRAQLCMASFAFIFAVIAFVLAGVWSTLERDQFWVWDGREIAALVTMSWVAMLLLSIWRTPAARGWLILLGFAGNLVAGYAWHGFVSWHFVFVAIVQLPFLILALVPIGWLRRRMVWLRGPTQTV